jgi:hypothetical protein
MSSFISGVFKITENLVRKSDLSDKYIQEARYWTTTSDKKFLMDSIYANLWVMVVPHTSIGRCTLYQGKNMNQGFPEYMLCFEMDEFSGIVQQRNVEYFVKTTNASSFCDIISASPKTIVIVTPPPVQYIQSGGMLFPIGEAPRLLTISARGGIPGSYVHPLSPAQKVAVLTGAGATLGELARLRELFR